MRHLRMAVCVVLALALPALADAPETSPRPEPRPSAGSAEPALPAMAAADASSAAASPSIRPRPRPEIGGQVAVAQLAVVIPDTAPRRGFMASVRPEPRPEPEVGGGIGVQKAAVIRILPGRSAVTSRKGSVCGVPGIKGEELAAITSRVRGCGIADPVRVTSVDGVKLSMAATLDCDTAQALNAWVKNGLKPAFGRKDVVELRIAAHYACRPRNNIRGAPVSEHGRGKAIDVSGIVLSNGTTISVLEDWRDSDGKPMVKAYKAACGTFGTTLGPGSDRFHRDHMHFDTASQRNGPYCR